MKKIILLIFSLFLILRLNAQDDEIEAYDPTAVYDWLDRSYEDFFSQPVVYNKTENTSTILPVRKYDKKREQFVIIPTQKYDQWDSRWNEEIIGETGNCSKTIGAIGCAITSQAMIIKSHGHFFDPGTWDDHLKNVGSYYGCYLKFQNNALYNYSYANSNFTYISKQIPIPYRYGGLDSYEDFMAALVLKFWIDRGGFAIIKVNRKIVNSSTGATGPTRGHFMLVVGYYNINNPTLKDFIIVDPGSSYDNNKNLKLEHYYHNGRSPLFVSSTGYPTIRIYGNIKKNTGEPPEMPIFTLQYETGDYFNISLPTQKSAGNFNISWILKRNGETIETQNGESFSYYLTKPGDYTITLIVGGEHGITETTKSFTVTGEPIILPRDCYGYLHTIPDELKVTQTSIYFKYRVTTGCVESCNWNCSLSAIKATGPNYKKYKYGCTYNYSKLKPNTQYKFWASYSNGWACNEFWYCKYNYDRFFTDCHANIITTPNEFERNSKLTETGNVSDKAFNKIILKSGFSYKPQSAGDSYSAKIASGKQFWITCDDCDKKKSVVELFDNEEMPNDCEEDIIAQDTVLYMQETIDAELKIHIYPNPSKGIFNIDINQNVDFEVIVYNLQRKILYLRNSNQINLSEFPSGLYIVKVRSNGIEINERIMKID